MKFTIKNFGERVLRSSILISPVLALVCFNSVAQAAVLSYVPVDGITFTTSANNQFQFSAIPDHPEVGNVLISSYDSGIFWFNGYISGVTRGLPTLLEGGDVVGSAPGGYSYGFAYFFRGGYPGDSFSVDQSGAIGFKTNNENYGYADVSYSVSSKTLTIHSLHVESVVDQPITVVPEPSSLALVGLGTLAWLRRRRA
jgi:hypothetical protein